MEGTETLRERFERLGAGSMIFPSLASQEDRRDQDWWIREFEKRGALWIHDGNPRRPHALLTSGRHSLGFFNSGKAMQDPLLLERAVFDLLSQVASDALERVSYVIGPAMGAITLAYEVARQLSWRNETDPTLSSSVLTVVAEKETEIGGSFVFKRGAPLITTRCLLVEDVLTTGGSVTGLATAVAGAGCYSAGFVFCLVNRSGRKKFAEKTVVSLIEREMPTWESSECPLCKQGSEAIRPKGALNWARLVDEY